MFQRVTFPSLIINFGICFKVLQGATARLAVALFLRSYKAGMFRFFNFMYCIFMDFMVYFTCELK
jgi:hypothetical protein